jgi:hypothetical protein
MRKNTGKYGLKLSPLTDRGTPRAGNDVVTLKVHLYFEARGKWSQYSKFQLHTFEVILKAKKANGGPASWIAEAILAYDPRPGDLQRSANSLITEMTKFCEQKLGAPVRGITKMMISQSYL